MGYIWESYNGFLEFHHILSTHGGSCLSRVPTAKRSERLASLCGPCLEGQGDFP